MMLLDLKTVAKFRLLFLLCLCPLLRVEAQEPEWDVLPTNGSGVTPHEMLHDYLMDQVRVAVDRRKTEFEAIKTPEQIAAYQDRTRQFFLKQIGGLPERTPLNARTVGHEQRDGYRIEKVIFESQPSHFVTAILYLPDGDPPFSGVLVPCGHSANGKARDLYQRAPILMAKCGMAALCYDPLDQGERHQLLDPTGKPIISSSTHGHNLAGVGATLIGRNTATYRIWDGIRAIDYLVGRPEVDAARIGCTGISGGGTMTSYLMALDDRIQAAAPGCYITSFKRLLETIGPQDAEQLIHAQVGYGMDHSDYLMMRAPMPTLVMTATDDFFDIAGAWDSFRQAKRLYGRFGYAERVSLLEVDGKHGFPREMRVAAARWMRRWLMKIDDAIEESDFPVATDRQVQCTSDGEVMLLPGARSVYDLNVELEMQLAERRKKLWHENNQAVMLEEVRKICRIRKLSEIPEPEHKRIDSILHDGHRIDKLILSPEPGIQIPVLVFLPNQPTGPATLALHELGKQALVDDDRVRELLGKGHVVLAVDVRGVGETVSTGKHSYASYLPPEWADSAIAYLLGKSLLSMRTEDILVCARFLARFEVEQGRKKVNLLSIGRLGPASLHAAALEPELFDQVELHRSLISWSNVVCTPLSENQFGNLVHGALAIYDLPDLIRSLPANSVELIEPLDATEKTVGK